MKTVWKKVLIGTGLVVLGAATVLAVHIYQVTRPKITDAERVVMARVDFKQDIDSAEAHVITDWLYKQKGVEHVLCNPETNIAVFTFYPVQANANDIIEDLKLAGNYDAQRYMPDATAMQKGCPVSPNSGSKGIYGFFKNIF